MTPKKIFASPQDVENAFYEALERADLEAMMAVWAEDEDVVLLHPGGPRLVGYSAVRDAWRRIFESEARLDVRISQQHVVTTPFAVMHSVIEHVSIRDREGVAAPVAATNCYMRGALGWRMVAHHGSVVPPDSLTEPPKILH